MLVLDGAFLADTTPPVFRRIAAPTDRELQTRVAVGPRTGQKVFTLRSLSAQRDDDGRKGVAEYAGFSLHADVHVRLKTPYRDGTTHIVLEPLDFMARLAALVPPPRVHHTGYHGRARPGQRTAGCGDDVGRGQGASEHSQAQAEEGGAPKAVCMTWMQRLKCVFAIEIETCQRCGGKLEVIA